MHRFHPTRASPPIRPSTLSSSTPTDNSITVAPELLHLSAQDVDILDAVIQRAGPSATTFFNIFKAYSDVLKEKGLDPQEVIYYGKLLKLGTLKGRNWGEKWAIVKAQVASSVVAPTHEAFPLDSDVHLSASRLFDRHPAMSRKTRDPPILSVSRAETQRELPSKARKVAIARTAGKATPSLPPKFRSDIKAPLNPFAVPQKIQPSLYPTSTVTSDDDGEDSSPVPPSYKSTNLDATMVRTSHPIPSQDKILSVEGRFPPLTSESKKTVDLDDAWKNIRMEQDEGIADKFREDVLTARCWEMWRQGFLWIATTNQQIGEARDRHLLELFMKRWRNRQSSRQARENELVNHIQKQCVKRFLRVWQSKLKQKRQLAWRNDMRQKMKFIKNQSEIRTKKNVWAKWRQLQLSVLASKHYELSLLVRYHSRWKARLVQLDNLDILVDHFSGEMQLSVLRRFWNRWKETNCLRHDENTITRKVDGRIVANSFGLWRKRIEQIRAAEIFSHKMAMKRVIHKWKQAGNSLKVIGHRADKYIIRQDELLLRAVIRIWRARTRGKRIEIFRASIIVRDAWQIWKKRMTEQNIRIGDAATFFNRTNNRLVTVTLHRWRQVLKTHHNAYTYAITHDEARLRFKTILLWRLRLQENMQSAKVARWANKFFATRRTWHIWIAAMEERKRQERLKLWNSSRTRRIFNVWRRRTQGQQYLKQCEQIMQDRQKKRILFTVIARWTNRVIEIKSRELDVAHRQDVTLKRAAFQKWQTCCRQHIEEVSLLENYLLVKQEDVLSKAFHRWLTAKRTAEHRRLTHQRKEAHVRQMIITSAWERWRERFNEERLRPLEYEVIIQNQKNVMHQAFRIWFSKTQSLPAVKFHSNRLKEKFLVKWKNEIPNAARAKKARETHIYNTLVNYFEKWAQAHKTKTTLKAVARAKYLRLLAPPSRQAPIPSRPVYSGRNQAIPRRILEPADEDVQSEASDAGALVPSFVPRARITRSPRARSDRSVPRSDYGPISSRQPSPVRSIVSMPSRRSRSPSSVRRPDSPTEIGSNGGRFLSAFKDLGSRRRPRNL